MTTHSLQYTRFSAILLTVTVLLLSACTGLLQPQATTPLPDPQKVIAILHQYPGGTILNERSFENGGDPAIQIVFQIQTTKEAAIAYYDPLFKGIGFKQTSSTAPLDGGRSVDQAWSSGASCPFHYVTIATTASRLEVTYVHGPCR